MVFSLDYYILLRTTDHGAVDCSDLNNTVLVIPECPASERQSAGLAPNSPGTLTLAASPTLRPLPSTLYVSLSPAFPNPPTMLAMRLES